MRKFVNDPRAAMREMLEGVADFAPDVALMPEVGVIVRSDLPAPAYRGVALISGGGSGHEPAHAGYVGQGMLHAAVAGDVFTSPSVDAVLAGIRAAAGPAGAVLIIKNYTGDRLNFGLAAELARAEGIPCEIAIVGDDVALRDTVARDQRRGLAGTVLVHKIAGAAAANGLDLAAVAREAREAAADVGTIGVALGACTVPAAGTPGFALADDEMEIGLGIHGEPGVQRGPRAPADALVERMLDPILTDLDLKPGERVALLVNGLGGTPAMELSIMGRHALATLRQRGLRVAHAWVGNLLTALEMPGCSLSVMRMTDTRLHRIITPTTAPAWLGQGLVPAARHVFATPVAEHPPSDLPPDSALRDAVLAVAAALEAAETELTALDTVTGDGDLGLSLTRGAAAVRALPDSAWGSAHDALTAMAGALRRSIAGSSGPFYAAALLRAASALPRTGRPTATEWSGALAAGIAAISALGGAGPGDRTMLDALYPASDTFAQGLTAGMDPAVAWAGAVAAAEAGVEATRPLHPRFGRAAYLGARAVGHVDAGAAAVAVWLRAIAPPHR